MNYVIAILSTGALCAGWVLVQMWVIRKNPDVPGVEGGCWGGGCGQTTCDAEGDGDGDKPCSNSLESAK